MLNFLGKLAGACKILVESSCDTTSNLVVSTGSTERWNMDNKISYSAVHFKRNVIYLKRMGRLKLRETARTLSMGNVCRRAPRWDNNAVKKLAAKLGFQQRHTWWQYRPCGSRLCLQRIVQVLWDILTYIESTVHAVSVLFTPCTRRDSP